MKYKHLKIITAGLIISLFTWSCEEYLDQFNMDKLSTAVEISPSIAAPVAYGNFSIQDILETLNDSSGLISLTEDSLIYFYYTDTAYSLYAKDLIEIPDHINTETYLKSDIDIPGWAIMLLGDDTTFNKIEKLQFVIESEDRIDSLLLKDGNLNINIFSEFKHSGELNITSSNIFDENGDTLNMTFPISETDGSFTSNTNYDLSGYKLTMEEENDSAFITIFYNLKLTKSANPISTGEECGIEMTFSNLEFNSIFGFIAERSISDMTESIDIEFFNDLEEVPDIYFADPQFNIAVHNSFGVPLSLDINSFRSRSFKDGTYTDLIFKNDTMTPYIVYAPTVDQLGQEITTERFFNVKTSNIDELISKVPDRIEFSFAASTGNPPGSTEQNFLLDTSKMVLEAEVVLPMWLKTSGYTVKDTLDIAFDNLMANLSFIESINFRLTTTNEWPLELSVQIYFINNAGIAIDSLFQGETALLEAAPVNNEGELDRSLLLPNEINITLPEEDLANLENASRMILVARAVTTNNGASTVKFYSHYLLNYQLSIAADFRINPDELKQ